jgi:hypothetical protein
VYEKTKPEISKLPSAERTKEQVLKVKVEEDFAGEVDRDQPF